jgi:ABC-type phosphate transport system substrate-binding protein
MQKKKSQRTPRPTTGRAFSSNLTTPGMSFTAALEGKTVEQQQPQTHQVAVAGPTTVEPRVPVALSQYKQQTTGQSIRVTNVNSLPLDKMLRVAVMVVQIMTEFNGAVLEEFYL